MILGFFERVFPISLPFFPSSCGVNSKFTFVFSLPLTHHFLYSSSVHLCCHRYECSQNIAGLQFLSYVHMLCLGNTVSHTISSYPHQCRCKRSNFLQKCCEVRVPLFSLHTHALNLSQCIIFSSVLPLALSAVRISVHVER